MTNANTQDGYTIRDLAMEVQNQMSIHGWDGPKLLEGLREPLTRILSSDLSKVGVKSVAADMNLSTSLLYKWCQAQDAPDASGADNPLDRLHRVYELTEDDRLISWLCNKADGYFVKNPHDPDEEAKPLLIITQNILREFSGMLEAMSESIENDGHIDEAEAKAIRKEWEELKSLTESFVNACEKGSYHPS